MNRSSNFLEGSFNNRDSVRDSIQFRRERETQHIKRLFFFKNRPITFHNIRTRVIRMVKQNNLTFQALKSTRHFLSQSTVPRWSDSSWDSNFGCCYKSDDWSNFTYRVVSSINIEMLQITSSERSLMYNKKMWNQEWNREELQH